MMSSLNKTKLGTETEELSLPQLPAHLIIALHKAKN